MTSYATKEYKEGQEIISNFAIFGIKILNIGKSLSSKMARTAKSKDL
jgi:hypothetical protein